MKLERLKAIKRVLFFLETDDKIKLSDKPTYYIVTISGLSAKSREVLLRRELNVRYFPFHIGRISYGNKFSNFQRDFVIEDSEPYRLSKKHLLIETINNQVVLTDNSSRVGSIVNGKLLGQNIGGEKSIPLRLGENKIVLGGASSPYIFSFEVKKNIEAHSVQDTVHFNGRMVPVASLYTQICHRTKKILTDNAISLQRRILMGMALIKSLSENPKAIDLLFYFSAHPDTYHDVIVAHSANVAIYAIKLFMSLRYSKGVVISIGTAALVHDIGMYSIPIEIVNKKSKINNDEFKEIKKHSETGYEELLEIQELNEVILLITLEHHERTDGSGYPNGRKNMSEIAELFAIVDFFEAVTHHRPQRGPVTPHEGIKKLLDFKDRVFSRKTLRAFFDVFSLYPVFSVVRLSTGETCQVTKTNIDLPLKPIVTTLFDAKGQAPGNGGKEIDLFLDNRFIVKDISDRVFIDNYFRLY